jgi:hypothetical protein
MQLDLHGQGFRHPHRSVVAALAGDWEAARDVRLELPETGVCSSDLAFGGADAGSGCCGTAPAGARHGSATGISGGRRSLSLVEVGRVAVGSCC